MFEWQPLRERDADGRLVAAGVRWSEHRELAQAGCLSLAVLVCMAGAGTFLVSGMGGALVLGLGIWLWRCSFRLSGRQRELLFRPDGSMKAPLGFAHYQESCREILGHNADIVSIEMRKEGAGDIRVVMFFRGGDVVHAAGSLLPDEAHKIAVQLTLALVELREDMYSSPFRRSASSLENASAPVMLVAGTNRSAPMLTRGTPCPFRSSRLSRASLDVRSANSMRMERRLGSMSIPRFSFRLCLVRSLSSSLKGLTRRTVSSGTILVTPSWVVNFNVLVLMILLLGYDFKN